MTELRIAIVVLLLVCAYPMNAQPLINAARDGDVSALDTLLKAGADPNVEGPIGTALHIVSLKGQAASAERLLAAGADVNARSDRVGTPLLAAVSAGGIYGKPALRRSDVVSVLIDGGADVDAQTAVGMSALHFAVVSGDEETIDLLLQAGADVDSVAMPLDQHNNSFKTGLGNGPTSPLHIAVWSHRPAVVEKLLVAGAKPKPVSEVPYHGDAERGRIAFNQRCSNCHTLQKDETELGKKVQGPTLGNVLHREVASVDGYAYSDAMTKFGGKWDVNRLYSFILEPKLVIPGTNMTGLMPLDQSDAVDIAHFLAASNE